MLYYLFDYLNDLNVPGAGMFTYISFRSLLAIIIALLVSTIFGKHFISMLKRQQITETQRDESIDPFGVQKKDTPTMGASSSWLRYLSLVCFSDGSTMSI